MQDRSIEGLTESECYYERDRQREAKARGDIECWHRLHSPRGAGECSRSGWFGLNQDGRHRIRRRITTNWHWGRVSAKVRATRHALSALAEILAALLNPD